MLLKRKKLYEVKNKENKLEEHYEELHLTFKSKNQSPLIMLTSEYRVEFLEYARSIWSI